MTPKTATPTKAPGSSTPLPSAHSVMLCSRGYSFAERLPTVVDWAQAHGIHRILLLHCPEERFSEAFNADIQSEAEAQFAQLQREASKKGLTVPTFELIIREGKLQENILELSKRPDVTIISVSARMLDFSIADIKNMRAAFYFLD